MRHEWARFAEARWSTPARGTHAAVAETSDLLSPMTDGILQERSILLKSEVRTGIFTRFATGVHNANGMLCLP